MELKIGDKVKWSSTSNGTNLEKVGVVVGIVKENTNPNTILIPLEATGHYISAYGGGYSRSHKSYFVAVDGKTEKAKKKLYWPRVSGLTKI